MKKTILLIAAVMIATLMALSAFTVLSAPMDAGHNSSGNGTATATTAPSALTGREAQISQALLARGIPQRDIYLPNLNTGIHRTSNGFISPSYSTSPAPFGVGAYGIKDVNGNLVPFNLTTGSFAATVNVSTLQDLYAYDDGPTSVSMQLNAVLDNVAIFGHANYSFWTQNVLFYSARTHTVEFLDNLWNFSSPAFFFNTSSLYSYNGIPVPPEYYYDVGPSFHVTGPFSVTMYLNTTVIDGRSTVFYNYSITNNGMTSAGSYDQIQFNSTPASDPSYVAPAPQYLVSGTTITPDGYIPYDAEIMLGGPGDGSTAFMTALNATMQLKYMNSTTGTYMNVPSAYDVGSETGETSADVAVAWNQTTDTAHLTAGAAYVYGMWGINNNLPMYTYTGQVSPSNAFLFASPGGSFNESIATQIPLSLQGMYSFTTPIPDLAAVDMLSGYAPGSMELMPGSSQSFSMAYAPSTGDYTPLYAMDMQQLQSISTPVMVSGQQYYMLDNTPSQNGMVSPLFGSVNDYFFPGYYGILLDGVHNVLVQNMPLMQVQYEYGYAALAEFYGTPMSNILGTVLYDSSNVIVAGNLFTGFFQASLTELPVANLLLWNSQDNLIYGNYFYTMDSGMLIYNTYTQSGNNLVLGNYFQQDNSMNATQYASIDVTTNAYSQTGQSNPIGLTVYSNNNTIAGNAFGTYITAYSPNFSIYTDNFQNYTDYWDLGHLGNYWWNYPGHGKFAMNFGNFGFGHNHFGRMPYNNDGLITSGYDYFPMHLSGRPPVNYLAMK